MIHLDPLINSNNYDHYYHPGILSCPHSSSSLIFVHSIFTEHHCVTRPCARYRGFGESKPEPSLTGARGPVSETPRGAWASETQGTIPNNGGLYMAVREGLPEEVTCQLSFEG